MQVITKYEITDEDYQLLNTTNIGESPCINCKNYGCCGCQEKTDYDDRYNLLDKHMLADTAITLKAIRRGYGVVIKELENIISLENELVTKGFDLNKLDRGTGLDGVMKALTH